MAADYIPGADGDFDAWQDNFITYATANANKVAHYMLRWESTRGAPGPWSETASATIGA